MNLTLYVKDDVIKRARSVAKASGTSVNQLVREYLQSLGGLSAPEQEIAVPAPIARRKVELLAHHEVIVLDTDLILAAIDLTRLNSISLWDALSVQAAKAANCSVLYTEDLQHGSNLDGLEIVNPFADAG